MFEFESFSQRRKSIRAASASKDFRNFLVKHFLQTPWTELPKTPTFKSSKQKDARCTASDMIHKNGITMAHRQKSAISGIIGSVFLHMANALDLSPSEFVSSNTNAVRDLIARMPLPWRLPSKTVAKFHLFLAPEMVSTKIKIRCNAA